MPHYRYHDSDSSSDSGCFSIVLRAKNLDEALQLVTEEFVAFGREKDFELSRQNLEKLPSTGIIYSDLQGGT